MSQQELEGRRMKWLWSLAIFAGKTPLCVGVLIFIAWYFTRADLLMFLGAYTIMLGSVLFCVGLTCLSAYAFQARKSRVKEWRTKCALALALLVSNFPVAWGLVEAAFYVMSTRVVTVDNETDYPVESIMLYDPEGDSDSFGLVAARSRKESTFHFGGEGAVKYGITVAGKSYSGVLIGYITGGDRGRNVTITLSNKQGTMDVQTHEE